MLSELSIMSKMCMMGKLGMLSMMSTMSMMSELYCSVGNLRSVPCIAHCIVVFAQRRESMTDCETVQRSQNSSHHKRTYSRRVP